MSCADFECLLLDGVHESWRSVLRRGLHNMCSSYIGNLKDAPNWWLPGPAKCLRAFCVPVDQVKVVWMGESPYPRRRSATGYAFEDGRANLMFGEDGYFGSGIDTSLRTILKAWFVATDRLEANGVQRRHVEEMSKGGLVQRPAEIFRRGAEHGWLWLNAAPGLFVTGHYADKRQQVCSWSPVVKAVLRTLLDVDGVRSVLMGHLAREEHRDLAPNRIEVVHPAHRGSGSAFIDNQAVQDLLREWRCLIEA